LLPQLALEVGDVNKLVVIIDFDLTTNVKARPRGANMNALVKRNLIGGSV